MIFGNQMWTLFTFVWKNTDTFFKVSSQGVQVWIDKVRKIMTELYIEQPVWKIQILEKCSVVYFLLIN